MSEVYLDHNTPAPLDPRVAEAMLPVLTGGVGNASSVHRFGRRQAAAVDEAREHGAAMVGGRPSGVVFTVGELHTSPGPSENQAQLVYVSPGQSEGAQARMRVVACRPSIVGGPH